MSLRVEAGLSSRCAPTRACLTDPQANVRFTSGEGESSLLPTILHTADVHLGRAWSGYEALAKRLGELHWEGFERVCRLSAERGAVALVIAGDLFERPDPPARLVDRVRGVFKRTIAEGVTVIVAPGTHDAACAPRSVYGSSNLGGARVFLEPRLGKRFVAERAGSSIAFSGLAWDPQGTPSDYLADYARGAGDVPEVLVLHGEVGSEGGRRRKDLPVEPQRLGEAGADYVALGHRHQVREFRTEGRLWGAYSGTPFGLSFKTPELGPRTACLVTVEAAQESTIENLASTEVQWLRLELDITDMASQDDLLAAVRDRASDSDLVRLVLGGSAAFPPDLAALRSALSGELLHLEVEDSSLEIAPGSLETLADEQSVRGIFARRMLDRLSASRSAQARAEVTAAIREGLSALAEEG
jgi:DNA repair protein SbcD/Mre11